MISSEVRKDVDMGGLMPDIVSHISRERERERREREREEKYGGNNNQYLVSDVNLEFVPMMQMDPEHANT